MVTMVKQKILQWNQVFFYCLCIGSILVCEMIFILYQLYLMFHYLNTSILGDMVLYESHSVIHGRPFPMNGNYFANCFIHFEPYAPVDGEAYDINSDIPPYIVPGSIWEQEWKSSNPDGWKGVSSVFFCSKIFKHQIIIIYSNDHSFFLIEK